MFDLIQSWFSDLPRGRPYLTEEDREGQTDRERQTYRERQADGERQTDRDRQTDGQRDGRTDRERQTDGDRLNVWSTYVFSLEDVNRPFGPHALITPLKVKHVFYHNVTKDWLCANYLAMPPTGILFLTMEHSS